MAERYPGTAPVSMNFAPSTPAPLNQLQQSINRIPESVPRTVSHSSPQDAKGDVRQAKIDHSLMPRDKPLPIKVGDRIVFATQNDILKLGEWTYDERTSITPDTIPKLQDTIDRIDTMLRFGVPPTQAQQGQK